MIGPYKLNKQNGVRPLRVVTMIDPATGWFEVREIDTKQVYNVATAVELTWLMHYPRHSTENIIMDTEEDHNILTRIRCLSHSERPTIA
jgi:hypothetical protein